LSARDPVAAHADAELRLERLGTSSGAWSAAAISGGSYAVGAIVPLLAVYLLPLGERQPITFVIVLVALALTGWFAAWLTKLPALRLVVRNVVLGAATMAVTVLVGKVIQL
jgi:VIT1/CCC1 family predicted Fe2+/Mn2+ transporter